MTVYVTIFISFASVGKVLASTDVCNLRDGVLEGQDILDGLLLNVVCNFRLEFDNHWMIKTNLASRVMCLMSP